MYTDGSEELAATMRRLAIPHDTSLPGDPKNNARAERSVRHVLEGARTALAAAGLAVHYWPYAVRHFCLCHNARPWKGKASPWKQRFGETFPYRIPPLGCRVMFEPSKLNPRTQQKHEAK